MNRDEIERVRAENRIEDIVATYVELKPSGINLITRCPFHDDQTPSLVVFPHTQTWWCFGCGLGGDVFAFVQHIERLDFKEAFERLRERQGPSENNERRDTFPHTTLAKAPTLAPEHFTLLTAATEVYHAALFTRPNLLNYLGRRGFDADAIRRFRIGYASGNDLARYFRYRGWNESLARDLGLISSYGEYFRERIVIPELRDGQAIYLVGRAMLKKQRAKYLGLPGAPKPLYGFASAQGADTVFLVEGPFDLLTLINWGYAARGLLGAHLKHEHEREFAAVKYIYLVLDNDAEGHRACANLAKHFGSRARIIPLPNDVKDVNELAQRPNGRVLFERLVHENESP